MDFNYIYRARVVEGADPFTVAIGDSYLITNGDVTE